MEMQKLNTDCDGLIPGWYIEMMTTYPLCGLSFEWQAFEPDGNFNGVSTAGWSSPRHMRGEMFDAYPGEAIRPRGYINVALDENGGGDPYFIPTNRGDNPPLFQVYHDVSDDPDEIIQDGMKMAAEKLSDFFRDAVVWIPQSSEIPESFYRAS